MLKVYCITREVERDKSQLIANDDIYDFMLKIANCDNVIIVLTKEYVKSLNCMLEMSFLVSQEDWPMKAMVLVIDDSLYTIERKLEIINYWMSRKKSCVSGIAEGEIGKTIWEEEKGYIDQICDQVEPFFRKLSRRKNPSQIAIVNEIIKKARQNKNEKEKVIANGEKKVKEFLEKNGNLTIKEISEQTNCSQAYVRRLISNLLEKEYIERVGNGKSTRFVLKNSSK